MSVFSDNLLYLRKRNKISQQELADKIGVSRSIVGMYETDQRKPSFDVLEAIADIFNVNIDFLVGHVSPGKAAGIFRTNLAEILHNTPDEDIRAAGIDMYEADLVIKGALPLSFDYAYSISEQLGETIDNMMDKEKLSVKYDSGLKELCRNIMHLSADNRTKLLELSRLFLAAQCKTADNS